MIFVYLSRWTLVSFGLSWTILFNIGWYYPQPNQPKMLPDWNLSKICELFGSFFGYFWQKWKRSVLFFFSQELFGRLLGTFDKYVEILCNSWELVQRFGSIWKLFWAFLSIFKNSTEVLHHFLETPEGPRPLEFYETSCDYWRPWCSYEVLVFIKCV